MKTFKKIISIGLGVILICNITFSECKDASFEITKEGGAVTGAVGWQHYIDCTFTAEYTPKGTDKEAVEVNIDWQHAKAADFIVECNFQKKCKKGYFVGGGLAYVAVVAGGKYSPKDIKKYKDDKNYKDSVGCSANTAAERLTALFGQLIGL